jgi:hypothetical protein
MENKFTKQCPDCHCELSYKRKADLTYSIKNTSKCRKCRNLKPIIIKGVVCDNINLIFTKECPICNTNISFNKRSGLLLSISKGSKCKNCCNIGGVVSDETKNKISETLKTKYSNNTLTPNMAGAHSVESRIKMGETKRGSTLTEEHKIMISNGVSNSEKFKKGVKCQVRAKKISDFHIGKPKTEEHKLNMSKNHADVSGTNNPFYGEKHSVETKLKMRLRLLRWLESTGRVGEFVPFYNKDGCKYFNELMLKTNTNIQHAENGGEFHIKELGFWVDGYDEINNIVYEYDEKHHFNSDGSLIERDIEREKLIISHLKCKVIRVKG